MEIFLDDFCVYSARQEHAIAQGSVSNNVENLAFLLTQLNQNS
jgi:hypothetical protein